MLEFKSKQLAIDYLNNQDHLERESNNIEAFWYKSGDYYLSHGEYAVPNYVPRRYKNGWGIHKENYYYLGTFNAPKSGRIEYL